MVDPLALQQGLGVVHHLSALGLISPQLPGLGAVRVGNGQQLAARPAKGPVLGEQAATIDTVEVGQGVQVPARHPGQTGQGIGLQERAAWFGDGGHLEGGQLLRRGGGEAVVLLASLGHAPVGSLGEAQGLPEPAAQAAVALGLEEVVKLGPALTGGVGVLSEEGVQQTEIRLHNRGVQQRAEIGHAAQAASEKGELHISPSGHWPRPRWRQSPSGRTPWSRPW